MPRRLPENATSFLMGTLGAAQSEKPVGEDAAFEKGIELVFDKRRQARSCLDFDLRQESLELFLDQLIQDSFFGAPPLVVNWVSSWRQPSRLAHDLFLLLFFVLLLYTVSWHRKLRQQPRPSPSSLRANVRFFGFPQARE